MFSPFDIPPHPSAQKAAEEVLQKVHAYMDAHPESELHRCGKMFGVLVYKGERLKVKGERLGLPEEFIKHVWDLIHEQSLKKQE